LGAAQPLNWTAASTIDSAEWKRGSRLFAVKGLVAVVAVGGVAAGLGWIASVWAIGTPRFLAEFFLALAVVVCAFRWRWGTYAVLVYVTVEGFVTNSLYPSVAPLFFKDVLLGATYIGFLGSIWTRRDRLKFQATALWPLVALAALCAINSFNPQGVDPRVALVGIRVLLFYTPLYLLGLTLASEAGVQALTRVTRLILYTSLPITAYGVFQWVAGPGVTSAIGPGFARSIWVVGPEATPHPIYRPTSTFDFVGDFGAYLLFVTILAFAALHMPLRRIERMLLVAVFVSAGVAVVVQSQRTTWVLLPVAAAGIYLLARDVRGILRALPIVGAGVLVAMQIGGPVLANRLPLLTSGLSAFSDRFYGSTGAGFQSVSPFSLNPLIGHGTGTALGAIRYVTDGVVPSAFESGWFSPVYMFGICGLLVYIWLYGAVLSAAWQGIRPLRIDRHWVAIAVFCYLALTAIVTGPVNNPPTNVYFWFFAGLLGGLPRGARRQAVLTGSAFMPEGKQSRPA
jgi:hypothetical protein